MLIATSGSFIERMAKNSKRHKHGRGDDLGPDRLMGLGAEEDAASDVAPWSAHTEHPRTGGDWRRSAGHCGRPGRHPMTSPVDDRP